MLNEYFEQLSNKLSRISKNDKEEAIRFYKEYAEEANIKTYQEFENRFGTVDSLAVKISSECAMKKIAEKDTSIKNTSKAFFIIMATIFSLPLTFPVLIVLFVFLTIISVVTVSILFAISIIVLTLAGVSVKLFISSFSYIFLLDIAMWLATLGVSLVSAAISIILVLAITLGVKLVIKVITILMNKIIKRRINND